MPAPRKRPCSICREWFRPNARVGPRQHACSKPECQTARRRKTQAIWRAKNPEYAAGYRIQQRSAQEHLPEPLRLPPPLGQLPWDLAKDQFRAYLVNSTRFPGPLPPPTEKDQSHPAHTDRDVTEQPP